MPWLPRRSVPSRLGLCEPRNGLFWRTVSAIRARGAGLGGGGGGLRPGAAAGRAPQRGCASTSPHSALDKWMSEVPSGRRGALSRRSSAQGLLVKKTAFGVLHPRRQRSAAATFWSGWRGDARRAFPQHARVCSAHRANTSHKHRGFLSFYELRLLDREISSYFTSRPKIRC